MMKKLREMSQRDRRKIMSVVFQKSRKKIESFKEEAVNLSNAAQR